MMTYNSDLNPLNQLLECLIATNRNDEVENLVKKHVNEHNEHDLRYYLALSYASQDKIDEAIDELTSVNNGNGNALSKKLAFKLYINKAKGIAQNNDIDGLSSVLNNAVNLGLNDPELQKEFDKFSNVLPLAHLKAGQRSEAARGWEEELKKKPHNHHAIHNLALLYYWWARDVEENFNNESHDEIDFLWDKSIAYWVMLLNTETFWNEWKAERELNCSLKISEEDISGNVSKLIDERFNKLFHNYIDEYKKKGRAKDTERHEEYLNKLILEKKTSSCYRDMMTLLSESGLKVDGVLKRWELIRSIQEEEGVTPCFGTAKASCDTAEDCCWVENCVANNAINNENLSLSDPRGPIMIQDINISQELLKLAELSSKRTSDNEKILKFLIYLTPLGKYSILIDEQKKPHQAIDKMAGLHDDIKDSIEYKFLYAHALLQKCKEDLQKNPISVSLEELSMAKNTISDAIKVHKDHVIKPLLGPVSEQINSEVVSACKKEARRLKGDEDYDAAISILLKGMEVVKAPSLSQHVSVIYCDRGDEKLSAKKLAAAREDFQKAISYDSSNMRAKQGIGTTYNNEGVNTSNDDKAISLFKKALEYDPNSQVLKNNLVGAYNGKAVKILDKINQYSSSSDCDIAINLLKKGLKLENPSLDVDDLEYLAYKEEWDFKEMVKELSDGIYRSMIRNLWIGYRNRKNLRGY